MEETVDGVRVGAAVELPVEAVEGVRRVVFIGLLYTGIDIGEADVCVLLREAMEKDEAGIVCRPEAA